MNKDSQWRCSIETRTWSACMQCVVKCRSSRDRTDECVTLKCISLACDDVCTGGGRRRRDSTEHCHELGHTWRHRSTCIQGSPTSLSLSKRCLTLRWTWRAGNLFIAYNKNLYIALSSDDLYSTLNVLVLSSRKEEKIVSCFRKDDGPGDRAISLSESSTAYREHNTWRLGFIVSWAASIQAAEWV